MNGIWNQLSIKMIRTCGNSITFPLKYMINEGAFLEDWKKSNVVVIHKRGSKNLSHLYHLDFNTLFNSFFKYKLFTPVNLTLYQVIPVFHNYYQSHIKFMKVFIATHPPI